MTDALNAPPVWKALGILRLEKIILLTHIRTKEAIEQRVLDRLLLTNRGRDTRLGLAVCVPGVTLRRCLDTTLLTGVLGILSTFGSCPRLTVVVIMRFLRTFSDFPLVAIMRFLRAFSDFLLVALVAIMRLLRTFVDCPQLTLVLALGTRSGFSPLALGLLLLTVRMTLGSLSGIADTTRTLVLARVLLFGITFLFQGRGATLLSGGFFVVNFICTCVTLAFFRFLVSFVKMFIGGRSTLLAPVLGMFVGGRRVRFIARVQFMRMRIGMRVGAGRCTVL